jgi:hypothetical protein
MLITSGELPRDPAILRSVKYRIAFAQIEAKPVVKPVAFTGMMVALGATPLKVGGSGGSRRLY